jgi:putative ABC transport system permease protein
VAQILEPTKPFMLDDLRFRLRALFRREALEEQLKEELHFHFDREVEKLIISGFSREEALRRARLNSGGVEQIKEDCREARGVQFLENLLQDFRFARRQLRKNPGFAAVAIFTLSLGIGANTAIFGMVNALLLHPYDFPDLYQLVRVWEYRGVDVGIDNRSLAPADAAHFADSSQVFSVFATYRCRDFNLTANDAVQPVRGCRVSANFFDALGVYPDLGRSFTPDDDQPGAGQVVILSHRFWKRLGANPAPLGSAVQINGRPYTIIGIMPPRFDYPVPMEFWVPLALTLAEKADRSELSLEALARLKPGVPVLQAQAALASISRRLEQEFPLTNANRAVSVMSLRRELYSFTLPLFLLLQSAALFVLLLAMANLVNVYFARMVARQREFAMRLALGAARRRLAQLLICESLMLSAFAALVAIPSSFASVRALRASISPDWTMWVPGWDSIDVDTTVLVFTLLTSLLAGLIFGLCSVYHAGKMHLNQTLKEGSPDNLSPATVRMRSALVVAQVVFALTLLVSAGLMIQGFTRLADIYKGFEPSGVLKAEIVLPDKQYTTDAQVLNFQQELLRRVAALPGVSSVALNSNTPASNVDNLTALFTVESSTTQKVNETPSADIEVTSPNYFQVLHIPLLSGRGFSDTDTATAPQVAVISESMATHFWPVGGALGRRFKLGPPDSPSPWFTVIGIVSDVRQNWWNPATRAVVYQSFLQSPEHGVKLLLRTSSNPQGYASSLREIVRKLDPEIAVNELATLEREVTDSIAIVRIMGILMGIFGGVAMALSAVGVYGVIAENVAQRNREFGIRLALGACPSNILKQVMLHSLKLTSIGIAIALPLSFFTSQAVSHYVFGLVTLNLAVPLLLAAMLLAVGTVAAYLPASRAMNVDPIVVLRHE